MVKGKVADVPPTPPNAGYQIVVAMKMKDKFIVKVPPSPDGFKTMPAVVISNQLNCRDSHRDQGYIAKRRANREVRAHPFLSHLIPDHRKHTPMNVHILAPGAEAPQATANMIPRETIGNIVEHRNRALVLYGDAQDRMLIASDAINAAAAEARKASPGENKYNFHNHEKKAKPEIMGQELPDRDAYMANVRKVVDLQSMPLAGCRRGRS